MEMQYCRAERQPMAYVDAHIIAPQPACAEPQPEWEGAILFGASAAEQRRLCSAVRAGGLWLHAEPLACLVGPTDPRFPSTAPAVLDLQLPVDNLPAQLRKPVSDWWPLANAAAANGQLLRLNLPPGAHTAVGVRKLAQRFPHTRFLLDPFRHGPVPGWQAQVRLAEWENVWLTTLGLVPGAPCRWPHDEDVEEAFYFATGEVGAGRLLFASGRRWEDLLSAPFPTQWLSRIRCLDDAQRALVLEGNARELCG
jgi:hypothetical protein